MSKNNVENILSSIPEKWEALKAHMENTILPALQSGRPLTSRDVIGLNHGRVIASNCDHLVHLTRNLCRQ
jgi:hypothetical protein